MNYELKHPFLRSDPANDPADGILEVRDVTVDYIVRKGRPLIVNTRTAKALEKAGIPRSQWNFQDQTGNELIEGLLDHQLRNNNLGPEGSPNAVEQ